MPNEKRMYHTLVTPLVKTNTGRKFFSLFWTSLLVSTLCQWRLPCQWPTWNLSCLCGKFLKSVISRLITKFIVSEYPGTCPCLSLFSTRDFSARSYVCSLSLIIFLRDSASKFKKICSCPSDLFLTTWSDCLWCLIHLGFVCREASEYMTVWIGVQIHHKDHLRDPQPKQSMTWVSALQNAV